MTVWRAFSCSGRWAGGSATVCAKACRPEKCRFLEVAHHAGALEVGQSFGFVGQRDAVGKLAVKAFSANQASV